MNNDILLYVITGQCIGLFILCIVLLSEVRSLKKAQKELERGNDDLTAIMSRQDMLSNTLDTSMQGIRADIAANTLQTDQKLEFMRRSLDTSLTRLRSENTAHLNEIRNTVDTKLQDTLDKKLSESFAQVSERLEQVYKGLGEMQSLASGVGDLKRVLSNVKTRGIIGEIQLGAILADILSSEQYATNVSVKKGSQANVEYAVKLPGTGESPVWLPIDSKFPLDCYEALLDAYDSGNVQDRDTAIKELRTRLRRFAKDIHDKYISPPDTTDFAIMFLPSEGLYAEAVRIGMVEELQHDYKISIAGPTTMGSLLNSLQMGFKTLAIQKRSSEVWQVLSAVKREFDTFGTVLEQTQKRILQANDELDKLVGVRTRRIQSTLSGVQRLEDTEEITPMEDFEDV